jgi:succinoglycan biosynthesis transport protein ExoP
MGVSTIGQSRVLAIRFTATSPNLAAQVANTIVDVYIEDQLESSYAASERATEWLRERSEQLRGQSQALDARVEQFRRENGLVASDNDTSNEAQYENLTRNVAEARSELVDLRARSRQLNEIVARGDTSAFVGETASQGITASLRTRYLDTLRTYNNLVATLGEDHSQTLRRERELNELEALMFEEVKRSATVLENEVEVLRERLVGLEEAQQEAAARLGTDNEVLLQLRELERGAETVRDLYTSFLQRYQQSLQQQEIPVVQARILNPARPAGAPSAPNASRAVFLSVLLGLMVAGALIALRELRDNKLRSEDQVRNVLGMEFLGGLTLLKGAKRKRARKEVGKLDPDRREILLPEMLQYAKSKPLSNFAETLRTAKMSVTLRQSDDTVAPVVGVLSCFPGEGKTTTAANFASLLADQGARVMLIDGDMRNPGLTRALEREFDKGLVDILLDQKDWREIYQASPETGLHVIPNTKGRVVHTAELLGGDQMRRLIAALRGEYDYVIIDLPPLGPVVDARALLDRLDGVFFVAKWGDTNIDAIQKVLRMDPRVQHKSYGAFLNMFDVKKAAAYGSYEGASYYRSYYNNYYRDV